MSKRKLVKPRRTEGKIWCGMYRSPAGRLGWLMPKYLSPNDGAPLTDLQKKILSGRGFGYAQIDMYRVKAILIPLKDKRGKFIVRRVKKAVRKAVAR